MSVRLLRIACLAALALASSPAHALDDLTGTYEGSASCETTNTATSGRTTQEIALFVDDANDGNAFAYLNNSLIFFRLAVLSPTSPDAGQLGGPSCSISPDTGGYVLQASVKAKAGSGKAALRGELIATNVGAASHLVQVCRFSLKRTTTQIPSPIPSCP